MKILLTGSGVFGFLRAFSSNYIQFAAFEFFDALFGAATYATALIIGKIHHILYRRDIKDKIT
jgi:hypothetical protein